MNELLENLTKALRASDGGSKVIAALVGVAVLVAIGVTGLVARTPSYDLLFQNLDEQERSKVGAALAEAGIAFEASPSPGPYNIYVDESDRSRAVAEAFKASAFNRPLKGIVKSDGLTPFMSATEREQQVDKAMWGEAEAMLESLDFITGAQVLRPKQRSSPLLGKGDQPSMASVSLTVVNNGELTDAQARTIARMVQTALGVDEEHLTISDQAGRTVFDGRAEQEGQLVDKKLLDHQLAYDRKIASKVEELLAAQLGPGRAHVVITSQWDWEQSAQQTTEAAGDPIEVKTETHTKETPVAARVGGVPGITSNAATGDYGTENTSPSAGSQTTSKDEIRTSVPTIKTTHSVRNQPVLMRLSIVGAVDASVVTREDGTTDEALVQELEEMVRAAAGYDPKRNDTFAFSTRTAFFQPEADADGPGGEGATEPNPMIGMLLRRGVEIVTALVFGLFLLKSLKPAKPAARRVASKRTVGSAGRVVVDETDPEDEIDPEQLARAQIQDLLASDPEKVGSILAGWAREEAVV